MGINPPIVGARGGRKVEEGEEINMAQDEFVEEFARECGEEVARHYYRGQSVYYSGYIFQSAGMDGCCV